MCVCVCVLCLCVWCACVSVRACVCMCVLCVWHVGGCGGGARAFYVFVWVGVHVCARLSRCSIIVCA